MAKENRSIWMAPLFFSGVSRVREMVHITKPPTFREIFKPFIQKELDLLIPHFSIKYCSRFRGQRFASSNCFKNNYLWTRRIPFTLG